MIPVVLSADPRATFETDVAGVAKMRTLEFFFFSLGWRRALELDADPVLSKLHSTGGSRAMQMRLVRYERQGLLVRRRVTRGYEYQITSRGEDRLFHLWQRFGELREEEGGNGELLTKEQIECKLIMAARKVEVLKARLRGLGENPTLEMREGVGMYASYYGTLRYLATRVHWRKYESGLGFIEQNKVPPAL